MFGACRRIGTDAPRPVMTMGFALRIYYSKNLDSIMIYAVANSVSLGSGSAGAQADSLLCADSSSSCP